MLRFYALLVTVVAGASARKLGAFAVRENVPLVNCSSHDLATPFERDREGLVLERFSYNLYGHCFAVWAEYMVAWREIAVARPSAGRENRRVKREGLAVTWRDRDGDALATPRRNLNKETLEEREVRRERELPVRRVARERGRRQAGGVPRVNGRLCCRSCRSASAARRPAPALSWRSAAP